MQPTLRDFQIIPRIVTGAGKKPDIGCFSSILVIRRRATIVSTTIIPIHMDKVAVNATSQLNVRRFQGKGPCRVPKAFPKRRHEAIYKK